jgi:hypothetical protein
MNTHYTTQKMGEISTQKGYKKPQYVVVAKFLILQTKAANAMHCRNGRGPRFIYNL